MGDHDAMSTEDGWVVCRCGSAFSDNTTEEALARHRRHARNETVNKPGLAQARAELEGGVE